ncbi:eukaryotic translation initiation factor-like [Nicotiana tabacum]|uniref:Eukaryotic translation initiation factor-like n=1 Tax=Nicotiana tabacum TaxID=4097 RepID=A0AC58RW92_TOBAC
MSSAGMYLGGNNTGILNNPTLKRFDLLKSQLIIIGITSAAILKAVVTLIFDKAVLEPTFCLMYIQLFFDLNKKLPPFPSDESGCREITLKYVLLNNCQKTFEGADNLQEEARQMTAPEQESERKDKEKLIKLRTLGNIQLIGEIFKLRMEMLIYNHKCCLAEENVEPVASYSSTLASCLIRAKIQGRTSMFTLTV